MLGQHDGPASQGYYGTERWRVGDLVHDRHIVTLNAPYDAARAQIVVGLYRWASQEPAGLQHLHLLDAEGAPGTATSVTLAAGQVGN